MSDKKDLVLLVSKRHPNRHFIKERMNYEVDKAKHEELGHRLCTAEEVKAHIEANPTLWRVWGVTGAEMIQQPTDKKTKEPKKNDPEPKSDE